VAGADAFAALVVLVLLVSGAGGFSVGGTLAQLASTKGTSTARVRSFTEERLDADVECFIVMRSK
jgi:hypothetical protein